MDSGEHEDLEWTLTRRRDVLGLLEEGSVRKPGLASELVVARSTVDRAVRELQAHALVERGDGGSELTTWGEVAVDPYETPRGVVWAEDRVDEYFERAEEMLV